MTWLLAFVRASAEWSAVSAQANFGIAKVKPQSGGRSQNHLSQRLGEAFRSQNQHSQGVPA